MGPRTVPAETAPAVTAPSTWTTCPTFADFLAATWDVLGKLSTKHEDRHASRTTLHFQEFDDVSLLAS